MSSGDRAVHRGAGFTLVELLLALLIAVTLLTLLYQVFRTVSQAALSEQEKHGAASRTDEALQDLVENSARMFLAEGDEDCRPGLEENTESDTLLTRSFAFCCFLPPPDRNDLQWADAWQISYRLENLEGKHARLVETRRPLAGPGAMQPPATNVLLKAVTLFQVKLHDGETWRTSIDPENPFTPHAAEITLGTPGDETRSTRIYLPAGGDLPAAEEPSGLPAP